MLAEVFLSPEGFLVGLKASMFEPLTLNPPNIRALIILIGFWGPSYHNLVRNPQNTIGSYLGPYTKPLNPETRNPKQRWATKSKSLSHDAQAGSGNLQP